MAASSTLGAQSAHYDQFHVQWYEDQLRATERTSPVEHHLLSHALPFLGGDFDSRYQPGKVPRTERLELDNDGDYSRAVSFATELEYLSGSNSSPWMTRTIEDPERKTERKFQWLPHRLCPTPGVATMVMPSKRTHAQAAAMRSSPPQRDEGAAPTWWRGGRENLTRRRSQESSMDGDLSAPWTPSRSISSQQAMVEQFDSPPMSPPDW